MIVVVVIVIVAVATAVTSITVYAAIVVRQIVRLTQSIVVVIKKFNHL